MKVVSVCSNDWSNFAYNFSEALKSVGVDSYSYCLASHPFGYEKQSEVVKIDQLKELTKDADFIVVHHSCSELLPHISDKKVIHYAAGTKYRQGYQQLNEEFKNAVFTFIALPEFQVYAPKGFHYVVGAIDCDYLKESNLGFGWITTENTFFAHYPSNHDVKGTRLIVSAMNEIGVKYKVSTERASWAEQIGRLMMCDVYIEMLAPEQGGKPYGSFGITALEAAALGKVVITQNVNSNDLYYNTYGGTPLELVKDYEGLKRKIELYAEMERDHIKGMQALTRNWVVKNHSYQATGKRVLNILNGL